MKPRQTWLLQDDLPVVEVLSVGLFAGVVVQASMVKHRTIILRA